MISKERRKSLFTGMKGFVAGCIIMAMTTTFVFAQSIEKAIKVIYDDFKIYVDGNLIEPKDANGNKVDPFIYNGTTYLPVRAVADALGENVKWEGKTKSIYIGKAPGGHYMSDILEPYYYNFLRVESNKSMAMASKEYYKGYRMIPYYLDNKASFNLNAQYSTIKGVIGLDDTHNSSDAVVTIYADDSVLKKIELPKGCLPKELDLDVGGVLKLDIDVYASNSTYVQLCDLIIE